jgi:hypothetical protein
VIQVGTQRQTCSITARLPRLADEACITLVHSCVEAAVLAAIEPTASVIGDPRIHADFEHALMHWLKTGPAAGEQADRECRAGSDYGDADHPRF